jgi:hypothetical protein
VRAVVNARHDDVAALDEAEVAGRPHAELAVEETAHPRARDVQQRATGDLATSAGGSVLERDAPQIPIAPSREAPRPRKDRRALFGRAARIEHHEARVVDAAVGVEEPVRELGLQRGTVSGGRELHAARPGQ